MYLLPETGIGTGYTTVNKRGFLHSRNLEFKVKANNQATIA